MDYYYLNDQRQSIGPVTLVELKDLFQTGQIKAKTLVIPRGGKEWVPCSIIFPEFVATGTPAPTNKNTRRFVTEWLNDPAIHTIALLAPTMNSVIGEECGLKDRGLSVPKTVGVLKKLGFKKVMDTALMADIKIMEEGTEFLTRLTKQIKDGDNTISLPFITVCSPNCTKFMKDKYADFMPNISSCKMPQQMFGAIAKTYYAEKMNINPAQIKVVLIMPCSLMDFDNNEIKTSGGIDREVDAVLEAKDIAEMIRLGGINLDTVQEGNKDAPLGISIGVKGSSDNINGAMGSTARIVYALITGNPIPLELPFTSVDGLEGVNEMVISTTKTAKGYEFLKGLPINVIVVQSTAAAVKLLDSIHNGKKKYHFIEIRGCQSDCVGGGSLLQSPAVTTVYKELLDKPASPKARELLYIHKM